MSQNDLLNKLINESSMKPDDRLFETHRECTKKSDDLYAYRLASLALSSTDVHMAASMMSMAAEVDKAWEPLRKMYITLLTEMFRAAYDTLRNEEK